jgi:UDP-N-acetyl-D-mannosaminuronate dehydrogenase
VDRSVVALGKIGLALAAQFAGKGQRIIDLISIQAAGVIQLRVLAAA